jgi:hypothetical protein
VSEAIPLGQSHSYGPDDRRASKVTVGILPTEKAEASVLERWFSDEHDVRDDPKIAVEIQKFVEQHDAKTSRSPIASSVALMRRVRIIPMGRHARSVRFGQTAIDGPVRFYSERRRPISGAISITGETAG